MFSQLGQDSAEPLLRVKADLESGVVEPEVKSVAGSHSSASDSDEDDLAKLRSKKRVIKGSDAIQQELARYCAEAKSAHVQHMDQKLQDTREYHGVRVCTARGALSTVPTYLILAGVIYLIAGSGEAENNDVAIPSAIFIPALIIGLAWFVIQRCMRWGVDNQAAHDAISSAGLSSIRQISTQCDLGQVQSLGDFREKCETAMRVLPEREATKQAFWRVHSMWNFTSKATAKIVLDYLIGDDPELVQDESPENAATQKP